MKRLGADFYQMPTILLAERLLGKIFVHHEVSGRVTKGRIVKPKPTSAMATRPATHGAA